MTQDTPEVWESPFVVVAGVHAAVQKDVLAPHRDEDAALAHVLSCIMLCQTHTAVLYHPIPTPSFPKPLHPSSCALPRGLEKKNVLHLMGAFTAWPGMKLRASRLITPISKWRFRTCPAPRGTTLICILSHQPPHSLFVPMSSQALGLVQ